MVLGTPRARFVVSGTPSLTAITLVVLGTLPSAVDNFRSACGSTRGIGNSPRRGIENKPSWYQEQIPVVLGTRRLKNFFRFRPLAPPKSPVTL